MHDHQFKPGSRDAQIDRVVRQITLFADVDPSSLPGTLPAAVAGLLDDQPPSPSKGNRARTSRSRLKPDLRMEEPSRESKATMRPSEQTAYEYEQSLIDFRQMVGDVPVCEITNEDLLDYRDEARKLLRSMPKSDRKLPFVRGVATHAETDASRISTATLKPLDPGATAEQRCSTVVLDQKTQVSGNSASKADGPLSVQKPSFTW